MRNCLLSHRQNFGNALAAKLRMLATSISGMFLLYSNAACQIIATRLRAVGSLSPLAARRRSLSFIAAVSARNCPPPEICLTGQTYVLPPRKILNDCAAPFHNQAPYSPRSLARMSNFSPSLRQSRCGVERYAIQSLRNCVAS